MSVQEFIVGFAIEGMALWDAFATPDQPFKYDVMPKAKFEGIEYDWDCMEVLSLAQDIAKRLECHTSVDCNGDGEYNVYFGKYLGGVIDDYKVTLMRGSFPLDDLVAMSLELEPLRKKLQELGLEPEKVVVASSVWLD